MRHFILALLFLALFSCKEAEPEILRSKKSSGESNFEEAPQILSVEDAIPEIIKDEAYLLNLKKDYETSRAEKKSLQEQAKLTDSKLLACVENLEKEKKRLKTSLPKGPATKSIKDLLYDYDNKTYLLADSMTGSAFTGRLKKDIEAGYLKTSKGYLYETSEHWVMMAKADKHSKRIRPLKPMEKVKLNISGELLEGHPVSLKKYTYTFFSRQELSKLFPDKYEKVYLEEDILEASQESLSLKKRLTQEQLTIQERLALLEEKLVKLASEITDFPIENI